MYSSSVFVNDILTDIFNLRLTSENYINIGGNIKCDRNVFYYCISKNKKYLNYKEMTALKNLIMIEIQNLSKKKTFHIF
jgi:hypothetical protein